VLTFFQIFIKAGKTPALKHVVGGMGSDLKEEARGGDGGDRDI
jgi:hypothetical protein